MDYVYTPPIKPEGEVLKELVLKHCNNINSDIIAWLIFIGILWLIEPYFKKGITNTNINNGLKYWLIYLYKPIGILILTFIIVSIKFFY